MDAQSKSFKERLNIEWLKDQLKTIWCCPGYCLLCLARDGQFYSLDMEFAPNEEMLSVPLREVVNYVFNFDVEDYMPSNDICEVCAEKTIQSYVFITNTKKTYQILNSCFNDMESKVNDISCTLNDETNYENSNIMIVIEYDDKTYNQIKELNAGNNTVLTHKPITVGRNISTIVTETKELKEKNRPIIAPTPRVIRYPRTNNLKKKVSIQEKVPTPNMTLKEGKIVIEPLLTNTVPSSPRFNTYCCTSCEDIFTTYRSLKEHEKAKHNAVIFKCRFCNKVYNTQQYLDFHYRSLHNKSRCRFCPELFEANHLNQHLKQAHKSHVYSCMDCDLVYYTKEKLDTHYRSTHVGKIDNNDTVCIMCLKNLNENEVASHKCMFSCLECPVAPCIHYSYLMSYREQILNNSAVIKCIDCDYTTKRKEHLITHVNREHLDYHPFTCGDCGTQFYTKLSLKTHIMQFHQDLKCQYCDITFKSMKALKSHREACKLISRLYDCNKCVASFDSAQELETHAKLNHSEFVFPCTLCTKEFPIESSLEEHHARVHNGIQYKKRRKMIECTVCDITFRNIKEMLEHEQTHPSGQVYPCKVCPKSFQSLKKIYLHKQRHYSQRVKCIGCKKPVVSSYYNQHKVICPFLKDGVKEMHICDVCGKSFLTESTLKTHQQFHTNPDPCIHCGKMIKPISMKRHLELKHSVYANISETQTSKFHKLKCDHCDYVTRKKNDFENHVNKVHLQIKPYSCDICGKQFCGKSRLAEHMRTHSSNNTCYCPICSKKFANKVCLKMHVRRHTNENPYECNICFEKFRSSSIMKTHRLKKHQDKTISCPLCDAMYHLVAEMRFHVKKIHWKLPEPFDYRKLVSKEYYHLFQDRRLQKLGNESDIVDEFIIP